MSHNTTSSNGYQAANEVSKAIAKPCVSCSSALDGPC